eukprot:1327395-Amorphochlora_amoeboformis.AAC.2
MPEDEQDTQETRSNSQKMRRVEVRGTSTRTPVHVRRPRDVPDSRSASVASPKPADEKDIPVSPEVTEVTLLLLPSDIVAGTLCFNMTMPLVKMLQRLSLEESDQED